MTPKTVTMKTTASIFIMVLISLGIVANAQEDPQLRDEKEALKEDSKMQNVKVNTEMIERFNNCKVDGNILTWSDVMLAFDNQTLGDLYIAYVNADLNEQSLEDIKLTLENKQKEHLNNNNICEQDLARFNRVKKEINNKLNLFEAAVLK